MLVDRLPERIAARIALAALLVAALFVSLVAGAKTSDPVLFSFATVGDSRQDPGAADPTTLLTVAPATGAGAANTTGSLLPQDAIWLQNTKALSRILRTIQTQSVNLLVFNGDMIMGYGRAAVPSSWAGATTGSAAPLKPSDIVNSDLVRFHTQYAYWRGMTADLPETGTYVIPVAGNHESQCSSAVSTNSGESSCKSGKHAYPENEDAWRDTMGDLVADLAANIRFSNVTGVAAHNIAGLTEASAPGAADGLGTNQAELTYSFDIGTRLGLLHFAVINTDPAGNDGHAPTQWLADDFSSAKARGAVRFFVFGHKMAFTYNYAAASGGTVPAGGLDTDIPARDAFWGLIARYDATYFCGHEHTVHIDRHPDPTNRSRNAPWQVLVGSGGSPFEDKLSGRCPNCAEPVLTNPTDRYYAWAVVRVHRSGKVALDAYGFNDAFGPTQNVLSLKSLR